jgi:prefoldin subunit 5
LKELSENLEEEINSYKAVVEEYRQRLGSLLREMEAVHGNEEWFKKLSALQKSSKKEKGKGKKPGLPDWITFKDIMLSKDVQGEAQMLFEAIEEINDKLVRLTKIKETIEDLRKLGLGEDVLYVAYMRDEVPERIVLRKRGGRETVKKFEFVATFSAAKSL